MTDRIEQFEAEGTPQISLRLPSGEARIVEGPSGRVEVRLSGRESTVGRFVVEERGGEIVIEPQSGSRIGRWSGVDVEIRIGSPAEVRARLAAGDVTVAAPLESLTVDAGAGDIHARSVAGRVRVKTASGDISIGSVLGRLEVVAASGDVRVGTAGGEVNVKTAAGDIEIADAKDVVAAHSASGDIEMSRFDGDAFVAKTLSGDVRLGVTSGRTFSVSFQSLSGDVRTQFPVASGRSEGSTARLDVKTMSGDIDVRAAD